MCDKKGSRALAPAAPTPAAPAPAAPAAGRGPPKTIFPATGFAGAAAAAAAAGAEASAPDEEEGASDCRDELEARLPVEGLPSCERPFRARGGRRQDAYNKSQ